MALPIEMQGIERSLNRIPSALVLELCPLQHHSPHPKTKEHGHIGGCIGLRTGCGIGSGRENIPVCVPGGGNKRINLGVHQFQFTNHHLRGQQTRQIERNGKIFETEQTIGPLGHRIA